MARTMLLNTFQTSDHRSWTPASLTALHSSTLSKFIWPLARWLFPTWFSRWRIKQDTASSAYWMESWYWLCSHTLPDPLFWRLSPWLSLLLGSPDVWGSVLTVCFTQYLPLFVIRDTFVSWFEVFRGLSQVYGCFFCSKHYILHN